ncbi:DUF1788 domain-containing protein [Agromyces arachidis]|uniref:DUF1788 domain-containing protein n=1 Tax=Agromyces arachidis TaxID=766966 RepID=UPI004056CE93
MNTRTALPQQEEHLFRVMSSPRFLAMEGLNNEIPVYIYPYDASKHRDVEEGTKRLKRRLAEIGVTALEINLHELAVDLLRERGFLEAVAATEPQVAREHFLEDLRSMLDPREHLVPAIRRRLAESTARVVILTGVGGIYPVIRSHVVLENIHEIARSIPVVMFFPGSYTHSAGLGSTLSLFDRLHDDRYYRARNILDTEV